MGLKIRVFAYFVAVGLLLSMSADVVAQIGGIGAPPIGGSSQNGILAPAAGTGTAATYSTSTGGVGQSSANITPGSPLVRIKCPQLRVENRNITSVSTSFPLRNIICTNPMSAGSIGMAMWILAGVFTPSCPADYPYLANLHESWQGGGGGGFWGGAAQLSVVCCSTPRPRMSMQYDTSTWQTNTYCQ